MKIIQPRYEILTELNGEAICKHIERVGRVCYKSEGLITADSAKNFVARIVKSGHEAVIEHFNITVRFVCNRGFTHELVRHRLASFAQESTRYVGYSDKLVPKDGMTEEDVITMYESGLSMKKISELSKGKYTEWEVYKLLDKEEVPRRKTGNTGKINSDFFSAIDSPEKAYLLGFIQADGSLQKGGNQIAITQKNGWFIERMLRDFIKPNLSSHQDRGCRQYVFSDDKLYDDILSKGIVPNKSNDMSEDDVNTLWDSVSYEYIGDFLRGLLDGDGSIRFFKQKNPGETDSCNISWNGNYHLMLYIARWLLCEFSYDADVKLVHGTKNLYRISITKPSVVERVCDRLYRNFVFPYGHPVKTSRVWERFEFDYETAEWGHPKFKVVRPPFLSDLSPAFWVWAEAMDNSEQAYTKLFELGAKPQEARGVLPIDVKTEIMITANLREWRHIFKLRTAKAAHPSMRELMSPLLNDFRSRIPVLFDDIKLEEE